jgi:curved DNA-binding protein
VEYKDYYKILGVARDASGDEIKRAYKKLARKYHPDVSKEADAEQQFKAINEAYQVLKDADKRKAYDQLGSQWREGEHVRPPPGWQAQGGDFSPEDLAGFSDFFTQFFGGGAGFQREQGFRMRGQDVHAIIQISLEDAFHGGSRSLSLQGHDLDEQGRAIPRTRQLNVQIPRGIHQGQQIRLAGQGGPGLGGGPAGDLYLEVRFAPHPLFHAEGRDIFLELPITPWEAALGARISIPTLGGRVEMAIPASSQSGRKLRLKERGLPGKPSGDQYLVLRIETPPADTESAQELYRRMAREMPFDPRKARGI